MEFRRKRRDLITLDITPLIDCVFLLHIFYMLSSTFLSSPGIRVDLPQAKAESVVQEKKDIRVKVDATGNAFLDNERRSPDDLEVRFRDAARTDRDTLVVIEADENVAHKYVVEVMDRAKNSGLHRLAIATRPQR